jgi:hypothetical protein
VEILLRSEKGTPLTHPEMDANMGELDQRSHPGWRDNIISLEVQVGDNSAPNLVTWLGGIKRYAFPTNKMTEASGVWHIDHDYSPGTALYPHIHWTIATANTGTVRWGFEYTIAKGHQQQAFSAPTTIYVEQASLGVANMHYVAEVSQAQAIPGALIEPDTLIVVRIFRDPTHPNDTLEAAVIGLCLDMHYQTDRMATLNKAPNFYA